MRHKFEVEYWDYEGCISSQYIECRSLTVHHFGKYEFFLLADSRVLLRYATGLHRIMKDGKQVYPKP